MSEESLAANFRTVRPFAGLSIFADPDIENGDLVTTTCEYRARDVKAGKVTITPELRMIIFKVRCLEL